MLWQPRADLQLTLTHAQGYQQPMRYFGTPLVEGRQLEALRHRNYNVDDSEIRFRDRWTQVDAMWTPNANVEWRTRVYQIDSQRDWRNAEAYVYNRATGLIDRSGNTEITHNQDQTGLTSTLRVLGNVGGWRTASRLAWMPTARTSSTPTTPMPAARARSIRSILSRASSASDAPNLPRYRNLAEQYALFVEDRLALSERWSVLGGLRRDRARIDRTDLISGQNAFSKTYSSTGWRAGTVLALQPTLSLYAQYSQAATRSVAC